MKLTIAWNVWNNYLDLKLGSVIARRQNEELNVFSDLYLISQGGYPEPPNEDQSQYIDGHFDIPINEDNRFVTFHPKFKGVLRVLNGVINAYEYARSVGSDYALVTNGDAWCLDLFKLKALLDEEEVVNSAISTRVGLVTGLDISWGDYVPFFDDHFMILNVALCEQYGVFENIDIKAFEPHFGEYGGIHYFIYAMMDEIVPPGLFNAYTDLVDCVNHYGDLCGYSLLPWQYQPSYGFLHANCEQEPFLHPLRAEFMRMLKLDRYPEVAKYCEEYPLERDKIRIGHHSPVFKISLAERIKTYFPFWLNELLKDILMRLKYVRFNRVKSDAINKGNRQIEYYKYYRNVKQLLLAQRRPEV